MDVGELSDARMTGETKTRWLGDWSVGASEEAERIRPMVVEPGTRGRG